MNNPNLSPTSLPAVGLLRRLMAIFYDSFLLAAILFIATALFNAATNQGEAIDSSKAQTAYLSVYLGIIIVLYFAWFWTHGGQTLGMKTWKIRLISNQAATLDFWAISWQQALIRELVAMVSWSCFGLGFLWSLFDRKKRCWHDIVSGSSLVDLRQLDQ